MVAAAGNDSIPTTKPRTRLPASQTTSSHMGHFSWLILVYGCYYLVQCFSIFDSSYTRHSIRHVHLFYISNSTAKLGSTVHTSNHCVHAENTWRQQLESRKAKCVPGSNIISLKRNCPFYYILQPKCIFISLILLLCHYKHEKVLKLFQLGYSLWWWLT